MPTLDELLKGHRDAITVKRVFGESYEKDGVTVIPAAKVMGGGGGDEGGTRGTGKGDGLRVRDRGAAGRRLRRPWRRGEVAARGRRQSGLFGGYAPVPHWSFSPSWSWLHSDGCVPGSEAAASAPKCRLKLLGASANRSAMTAFRRLSRAAIGAGRTFSSSRSDRSVLAFPLAYEVLKQQVVDERRPGEVPRKEHDPYRVRHRCRFDRGLERHGNSQQREIGDEPRNRLAGPGEHQRAERRRERPQRRSARGDEPPERPLEGERQQEHERELDRSEKARSAAFARTTPARPGRTGGSRGGSRPEERGPTRSTC